MPLLCALTSTGEPAMAFCVARLLIIAAALFTTGLRAAPPAGESPGFVPMVVNG